MLKNIVEHLANVRDNHPRPGAAAGSSIDPTFRSEIIMAILNGEFTRDPVAFLTNHALAIDYTHAVAGINQWVVEYDADAPPAMLRRATAHDNHTFSAYFLRYTDNNSHQLILGSMANLMFTPPLTGCSFVVDKKWYSPMVSHHNRQGGGGGIDQVAVDAAITTAHGPETTTGCCSVTANYYPVRKDDYVPIGQSAQDHRLYVVGVRGKLGWYMYRMKHDIASNAVVEAPNRIN
jgi:hypothetical protein